MTPQQARVLTFIREEIAASGISPTYEEIGRHLGLTTKSGVHRLVDLLVLDGKLVKAKDCHARNLRLPDHVDLSIVPTAALQEELQRRGAALGALSVRRVPVLGRIGATCAAEYCSNGVKVGMMYCRDHWFAIPRDVQDDLKLAHARRDIHAWSEAKDKAEAAIAKAGGRSH